MTFKKKLERICIFCGSKKGSNPLYEQAAKELGSYLAAHQMELIFGGGKVGLMGICANAALEKKGIVRGIIPQGLFDAEVGHTGVTELIVVPSMHERKQRMHDLSDGFIILPGGFGTLDELFETLTWAQLAIHSKPIGLLNIDGFYDELIKFLNKALEHGFLHAQHHQMLVVDSNIASLIDKMQRYTPPTINKAKEALKP